jgi:uncharacterized BrkB/YihY/UPF0761 family membrane protein
VRSLRKSVRAVSVFFHFFGRRIYNRWNDDHVFFSGASIAFNVLITILPLGVLIVGIGSMAVRESTDLQEGIRAWVEETNPFIPETIRLEVEKITTEGVGIPSAIGFLTLLWLVSRLFGTIRTAFDTFFAALATVVVDSPVGGAVSALPLIGDVFRYGNIRILAVTFTLLLYFMLYWAAPNRRVSFWQALFATVLATVLTSLGTFVYAWAIGLPDWGIVYGSLARIVATLFWLYWVCVILLGAAETSQVIHEWRSIRYSVRHLRRSGEWVDTVAE